MGGVGGCGWSGCAWVRSRRKLRGLSGWWIHGDSMRAGREGVRGCRAQWRRNRSGRCGWLLRQASWRAGGGGRVGRIAGAVLR